MAKKVFKWKIKELIEKSNIVTIKILMNFYKIKKKEKHHDNLKYRTAKKKILIIINIGSELLISIEISVIKIIIIFMEAGKKKR